MLPMPYVAQHSTPGMYLHPQIVTSPQNSDRADHLGALACADTACRISKGRTLPLARPFDLHTPYRNERSVHWKV